MTVLVTGGAGYIGSHMAHSLVERGRNTIVIDNLSNGLRSLVPDAATFIHGEISDAALLRRTIEKFRVGSVIHLAASAVVPESVAKPLDYYENNTASSLSLIKTCVETGVKNFIFSSTAAVYGIPEKNPVPEDAPARPISPYGRSKLAAEWILEDTANAHDFHYIALRYFNVAGADSKGRTGQIGKEATHLIKRACQAALGVYEYLEIFGTDFPTRDGTAIRDYIHVSDLVEAHALALDYLETGHPSGIFNCGYGRGVTVREVIDAVSRVAGHKIPERDAPPRPGDPPELVADPARLKAALNWRPEHDDLEEIVASAYAWEKKLNSR